MVRVIFIIKQYAPLDEKTLRSIMTFFVDASLEPSVFTIKFEKLKSNEFFSKTTVGCATLFTKHKRYVGGLLNYLLINKKQ